LEDRDSFAGKLKALIVFRVFLATTLLGTFIFFHIGRTVFPYGKSVFSLVVALYGLTLVYLALLGRVKAVVMAYTQLMLDVAAIIFLIYLTGGIESWFSFLLLVLVIAASVVAGKRGGFAVATASSFLYSMLIGLQYSGVLHLPYSFPLTVREFIYNAFSNVFSLYLCAYLTGYLSFRLEKTTRKLEEKAVDYRELALFNEEVVRNIPSGLFTTGPEGSVLIFNNAAESITGVGRDRAIGSDIRGIFPFLDGRLEESPRMEGVLERGCEKRIIGITVTRMRNAKGIFTGYTGIFQDLTELKHMQEEMRRKEKWAAIGELSANMAHEIRNPLASLRGSIEMLEGTRLNAAQRLSLMEIALSEMDRLNGIITDFLTYSRPTKPERESVELDTVLNGTLELLKKSAPEAVQIRTELGGPIPALADPRRMGQVFMNLGLNAFEAMPEGGVLTIRSVRNGSRAEISFADTGKGVSAEHLEKVFLPFFTTKEAGTGLGLAIAMRIMEDHGGTISVASPEGQGSVFTVDLPLETPAAVLKTKGKNGKAG
jgi:two-component system sensor histidine kinase PilS (NtrC family)